MKTNTYIHEVDVVHKKNGHACPAYLAKCKASQLTLIPHEIHPTTNQYWNILSDP